MLIFRIRWDTTLCTPSDNLYKSIQNIGIFLKSLSTRKKGMYPNR